MGSEPRFSPQSVVATCWTSHSPAFFALQDPSPSQNKQDGMSGCEEAAEHRFIKSPTIGTPGRPRQRRRGVPPPPPPPAPTEPPRPELPACGGSSGAVAARPAPAHLLLGAVGPGPGRHYAVVARRSPSRQTPAVARWRPLAALEWFGGRRRRPVVDAALVVGPLSRPR